MIVPQVSVLGRYLRRVINAPYGLGLPRAMRRQLPGRLRFAFMVFLLLEELDLLTSVTGHRGVVEGNALMAAVIGTGGAFAFLLVKSLGSVVVYCGLAQLSHRSRRAAQATLVMASLLMAAVVIGNLRLVLF